MHNSNDPKLKGNPLIVLFLTSLVLICGCANYDDPISYESLDGSMIVDVITEYQLSNDPDPFWQHVSIRNSDQPSPTLPGNIFTVPAHNKPKVKWISADTVSIEFSGTVGQSFKRHEVESKFYNDVFIWVILEDSIEKNDP